MAFFDLPIMVLFAKITPKNIEGTIFAMLTGLTNLSRGVLAPATGSIIDDLFFGVTIKNLSNDNMIELAWLETFMSILPIFFICLIPLRRDIKAYGESLD